MGLSLTFVLVLPIPRFVVFCCAAAMPCHVMLHGVHLQSVVDEHGFDAAVPVRKVPRAMAHHTGIMVISFIR